MIRQLFILTLLLLFALPSAYAIDVAPRISDREIIESLSELKAGQKNLRQKLDHFEKSNNKRFESLEKSIDKRFEGIDKRFDFIANLMLVMLAGIFGLIGFIVWDRKTALRPLEKRMEAFEKDVQHDLDLRHEKGSLLTRLVKSLQQLAKQDEKVAAVLRSYSLL